MKPTQTIAQRGFIVAAITQQLQINGMMTLSDLSHALGRHPSLVHPVLSRMLKPTTRPAYPKRVYIADWVYDQEGQRRYPRAVYALGHYPDAAKPKQDHNLNKRRYRDKLRMLKTTNSVFNLAGIKRGGFQINF